MVFRNRKRRRRGKAVIDNEEDEEFVVEMVRGVVGKDESFCD